MAEKERGYPICSDDKRGITKGRTVTGTAHSVRVPLNTCPKGTKPIGVHHSHPGGSLQPSQQDVQTMRDKNLDFLCIRANGKIKCYRNRGSRKSK